MESKSLLPHIFVGEHLNDNKESTTTVCGLLDLFSIHYPAQSQISNVAGCRGWDDILTAVSPTLLDLF